MTYFTPKDRMLRVLTGQQTDVLPATPAYISLFLADFERAYYIEQYRRRMRGLTCYRIDHAEDTRFRVEAFYQACGILKSWPDWLEINRGASRAWAEQTEIVAREGGLYYRDVVSGQEKAMHRVLLPHGKASLAEMKQETVSAWDISDQIQSPTDVDAHLPVVTAETLLDRGDFDLPRQVVADYGDRFFMVTILDTPYSTIRDLLGFQGLMLSQHDRPELLHYLLQRELARLQELARAWAAIGLDGVYVEEVFSGADLISARNYDEFAFTYNQPYFRYLRALGLLPIHYICGDAVPRLDRIVQLDVAAIAVEESKKKFQIEIEEVINRVAGRVTVFGNIDAVRFGRQAALADMVAEVRRQARAGSRARGFVLSTGSPFPLDTNPRLIDTLVATAHSIKG